MRPAAPDGAAADDGTLRRVDARAKLNLALHVLAREASGFHQIETIFCAIELADELEITTACDAGIHLDVVAPPEDAAPAPDLGPAESNLAWRAAASFFAAAGLERRVRIRLVKRIPAGAGLGGGSSDAAAVLTALNALHGAPLSDQRLLEIGGELGSDVPFFVAGVDLALAWGRGNRLAPLPPLPSRPVLLAVPPVGSSTAAAYARLAAERAADHAAPARLLQPVRRWDDVAAMARNEFEDVVFAGAPELAELREGLAGSGAFLARLTGTGSVVFGIYEDVQAAQRARDALAASHPECRWILTRT
jgi:4-diphosphocytidyl-2-C-methyl-D-erythritol kinase